MVVVSGNRESVDTIFSPEDGAPFSQRPHRCGKGAVVFGVERHRAKLVGKRSNAAGMTV
jgi:hypothetical protein